MGRHSLFLRICGNSSVVEHNLAKVGVASSNLVSRSRTCFLRSQQLLVFLCLKSAFSALFVSGAGERLTRLHLCTDRSVYPSLNSLNYQRVRIKNKQLSESCVRFNRRREKCHFFLKIGLTLRNQFFNIRASSQGNTFSGKEIQRPIRLVV